MRPEPGEVLHFSEDPAIREFVPHVAATASRPDPYVWAVDAVQAPAYWFPRQCPRAMAWVADGTTDADRRAVFGAAPEERVHVIEYSWAERFMNVRLYAYRLPADRFTPFGEPVPHAWVATDAVVPLGPAEPVGDLLTLHQQADIQLRFVNTLWTFWDAVTTSTLGFSGIRLRNATPR
ncbi:DUF6886 family protein [Streptomyces sp. VRA16 Mangrove soil]|uniref:DUF6886 family protein n=1 Tax=Streptomyces sp. VRA16 Mangrove soil TaxID=2817434 RepID=UPI001A9CE17B|nr:DUF6886 family protein [Streptomyces sp. VRA16 Mangrove soil]MBO1330893.1 hypothetical protein [Streptomyces sp. VRA16 Mangrove soil]